MTTPNTDTFDYYIPVLCVAGSDPSGGAGIQADLKTCEAFGCYGMAVVSGLTAQSPSRVTAVRSVSDFMAAQLETLLDEIRPAAVKTGMLPDVQAAEAIVTAIQRYNLNNVTVDPVMIATSGHALAEAKYIDALTTLLLPHTTIVTPNIPEAELLASIRISNLNDCRRAAVRIATQYGSRSVLVKGGHSEDNIVTDILYLTDTDTFHTFEAPRITTPNTHGTGCRLSTAIACGLGCGLSITEAVAHAKSWLTAELRYHSRYRFPSSSHNTHLWI
ncbi:MAG: bifunctional hydroxymethylpyrimidine kinase/phosphomethylpyrimidine kinase [Muribaculaceae bacterium]|nr:bifunctional hydroxymethylpyrimidine kinase/phosphomethylpyrimidine kinase [Muribaculaceae bacterium]